VQWQGCTGFLTSSKGCTSIKKVDNHWFKSSTVLVTRQYVLIIKRHVKWNQVKKKTQCWCSLTSTCHVAAWSPKHGIKYHNHEKMRLILRLYRISRRNKIALCPWHE